MPQNEPCNFRSFSVQVDLPSVKCDVCNRSTFTPPELWDGSWNPADVPPAITLRRRPLTLDSYPPLRFMFDGCMTGEETRATAIQCGWREVALNDRTVLVCPKCQELLAQIVSRGESPDAKT